MSAPGSPKEQPAAIEDQAKGSPKGSPQAKGKPKKQPRAPCEYCGTNREKFFENEKKRFCKYCTQRTKKCISCGTRGSWQFYHDQAAIFKSRQETYCFSCDEKLRDHMREARKQPLPTMDDEKKKVASMRTSNPFAVLMELDQEDV